MINSGGVWFIGLTTPPPKAGTLLGANDGLSTDLATGTIAQLGQAVGRAGDPAILTEDREIPDPAGHNIFIGRNNGVDNVVAIGPNIGIEVANDTGFGASLAWGVGGGSNSFDVFTDDGKQVIMDFQSSAAPSFDGQIVYAFSPNNLQRFDTTVPFVMQGTGADHRSVAASANVLTTDCVFYIDTTAGNLVMTFPAPAGIIDQFFYFKKTSADVNTVTLQPTGGTIQGIGAPAANFSFNVQGQSVMIHCDGTNYFIH